jgi:hypothetical protein
MSRTRKFLIWLAAIFAVLVVLLLIAGGAGWYLLAIAGIWAAMFAGGWLISRWTGGRPHYLETWHFDDGETVIWRDDRADIYILPTLARPAIARPLRLHRFRVLVTTRRILVATRELFTGRQRVVYVLHAGAAPKSADTGTFGGEFKTGYRTLVVQQGVMDIRVGEKLQPSPYVALKPDRAVPSSFNCAEFRIYTELHESFRLPGSPPAGPQPH